MKLWNQMCTLNEIVQLVCFIHKVTNMLHFITRIKINCFIVVRIANPFKKRLVNKWNYFSKIGIGYLLFFYCKLLEVCCTTVLNPVQSPVVVCVCNWAPGRTPLAHPLGVRRAEEPSHGPPISQVRHPHQTPQHPPGLHASAL